MNTNTLAVTEAVWAILAFVKQSPFYICSFYQSPNAGTDPLFLLQNILQCLQQLETFPIVIISGDFNLSSVKWLDNGTLIVPLPVYGREVNDLFMV